MAELQAGLQAAQGPPGPICRCSPKAATSHPCCPACEDGTGWWAVTTAPTVGIYMARPQMRDVGLWGPPHARKPVVHNVR